jgi:hypothetical protein
VLRSLHASGTTAFQRWRLHLIRTRRRSLSAKCFVLNRIAEAHGTTAVEMLGACPPPPRTFLDRLGDLYEAMARGDEPQIASCLRALEAAADPTLRVV